MFTIKIGKNLDEVARLAYEPFRNQLIREPKSIFGLATGSSPIGLYKVMIEDAKQSDLSYKHVKTFNLDEYVGLADTHDQSYHYFMNDQLFKHLDINPENIHIPNGNVTDLQAEGERYENLLNEHTIDIQLLGVGSNGHIGFNEPGTSFDSLTHVIDLQEQTLKDNARFFDSIEDVPTQAITMGIASIMKAKKIVLIATGEKKAKAIQAMIKGEITPDIPCTVLQNHPDVLVILDEASASLL